MRAASSQHSFSLLWTCNCFSDRLGTFISRTKPPVWLDYGANITVFVWSCLLGPCRSQETKPHSYSYSRVVCN